MYSDNEFDTICAISTPPGVGGIAVARVSGTDAIEIVNRLWRGKSLSEAASHTSHLGEIIDPRKEMEPLDTAVATIFRAPGSFTGENVVEISVHGSKWIQRELINLLIRNGCRAAEPGEFTRRAFMNGKLDLAQAEAVADIIATTSRSAHRLAWQQMKGAFSDQIIKMRDRLIEIASLLELELDFSEEDVEFASREHLKTLAEGLREHIDRLANSYSTGSVIKDGIPVAIVGEPNVGKSTLLNLLLNENRAIVSDIPGTTRDTIEDTIEIDGVLYRFIDTAGLRETDDKVETLGIERSYSAISKARIILLVTTPEASLEEREKLVSEIRSHVSENAKILVIVNKIDLVDENAHPWKPIEKNDGNCTIEMSAAHNMNTETLLTALRRLSGAEIVDGDDIIVTNARHYEALLKARDSIQRVIQGISDNLSGDFIAQDLRETIHHLSVITGTITTTDLLSTIFERFCIGK